MNSPWFWIIVAVVLIAIVLLWVGVWLKDSQRADDVAHDAGRMRQRRRKRFGGPQP